MLQLIKKDMAIHKFSWFIYLAMLIFFMLFDKDAIFITAIISASITMNAFYMDEQANGHKLWNALPFTRSEIVGARYTSLLIFTIVSISTFMLIELITKGGWELSLWKEMIGSFILMMLTGAFCFPVFYWQSQQQLMFLLLILYVLVVIGGTYLFFYFYLYLSNIHFIPNTWTDWQLFSASFLLVLCLYLLSWRLSVNIYKKREIN